MGLDLDKAAKDGDGGGEVEVTPEMISAGAEFLAETYAQANDWLTRENAYSVLERMLSCAPPEWPRPKMPPEK